MKKTKLTALMIIASLTVNGIGLHNMTFSGAAAETIDEVFDLAALGIRGDVNNDGKLSVFDLVRYKQYLLGEDISLGTDYRSDINGDGKKNIADFTILKSALLEDIKIWSAKNMPVMDGSTSAIPLEAGFKAKMLGINYNDAKTLVKHHKTHESFQMLLSGENDMIFTVPISESQQKDADAAGVHLNLAPVAKEGFVFVVNKNNPVDSLTQEQIRDIYSGKITNWKEVGGNDEKIIPYQRNQDSGSQNYMNDFMNGFDLMEPPKEYTIGAMGGLMDAIAVYDNSSEAIGYSVYSYAAQMYENSADVKFIAVDGVKPSRETMADSTYPLLSSTYIMYTDNATQNTLDFVEWATSEEGQNCVLENGYVPVMDIEYPDRLKLYKAVGTGKEKSADYKPSMIASEFGMQHDCTENDPYIRINLADKKFEAQIYEDIKNAVDKIGVDNAYIFVKAVNGYMSVNVQGKFKKYYDGKRNDIATFEEEITLNYDLINSRKIENFSDLFYKDTDFVQIVNDGIASFINEYMGSSCIKTDFLGITGEITDFTIDKLMLSENNPYFTDNFMLSYDSYWLPDQMVTGEYFDMKKVVGEGTNVYDTRRRNEWEYDIIKDENGEIRQIPVGSAFHTAEETENQRKLFDKVFSQALEIRNNLPYETNGKVLIHYPSESYFSTDLYVVNITFGKADGGYHPFMFDPETGDQIYVSDIFGEDFKKYDDCMVEAPYLYGDGNEVVLQLNIDGKYESVIEEFDPEKINKKYFSVPAPAESIALETPLKGVYKWNGETEYGYAASYIVEHGFEKKQWPIEGDWHITAKNKCWSYNEWWYECWDSDDGDYYGWISADKLYFNIRGER